MTYDPIKTRLLIKQTDSAGSAATLAEITLANQLSAADDALILSQAAIGRLRVALLVAKAALEKAGNESPNTEPDVAAIEAALKSWREGKA